MYSKEITAVILSDYAKGASAVETIQHLKDAYGITPNINTIYSHRKSVTTEQIVDELQRQQERDITKEQDSEVRMKYRNELLKILVPIRAEILSKSLNVNVSEVRHVIELADPDDKTPNQIQTPPRTGLIPLVNGEIQDSSLR